MASRSKRDVAWALSRAVQVGFLVGLLVLWYVSTNYWGVSHLLLPEPVSVFWQFVDIIKTGEFIGDLQVTLSELAIAFAGSCTLGITLGYLISRSPYAIKVFEPLFTTKARGIGLGLAVSKSLAQANDGDLALVSAPGEGACFALTLPVAGSTT